MKQEKLTMKHVASVKQGTHRKTVSWNFLVNLQKRLLRDTINSSKSLFSWVEISLQWENTISYYTHLKGYSLTHKLPILRIAQLSSKGLFIPDRKQDIWVSWKMSWVFAWNHPYISPQVVSCGEGQETGIILRPVPSCRWMNWRPWIQIPII